MGEMKEDDKNVIIDNLIETIRDDINKLKLTEKILESMKYESCNYSKVGLKVKLLELHNILSGIMIVQKLHKYIG